MTASKFTRAREALIMKRGEQGTPVAEICRKAGIGQATYFSCKKNTVGSRRMRCADQTRLGTRAPG